MLDAEPFVPDLAPRSRSLLRAIGHFRRREQSRPDDMPPPPLYEALIRTRFSLASHPRDNVFVLLGLTSDGRHLLPAPSYANSVEEINRKLTAVVLTASNCTNTILLKPYVSRDVGRQQIIPVEWSNLALLPPWLTMEHVDRKLSTDWACDPDMKSLRTRARFLCGVKDVAGVHVRSRSGTQDAVYESLAVMNSLRSCLLLERFPSSHRLVISVGRDALVPANAKPLDSLHHVDACHFPVFLRRAKFGNYYMVWEACVAKYPDGRWLSGMSAGRTYSW